MAEMSSAIVCPVLFKQIVRARETRAEGKIRQGRECGVGETKRERVCAP